MDVQSVQESTAVDTQQAKILIVDDEESVHKLISSFLKRHGYVPLSCFKSDEIVETVEKTKPDLILMDLMMPRLDGYQTCALVLVPRGAFGIWKTEATFP